MGLTKKGRSRRSSDENKPAAISASGFSLLSNWMLWLVLGVTFLAFANTLLNGFSYDDTTQILENQFIRDLRNLPKALVTETWYWRVQQDQDPNLQDKPSTPYYRPIFTIYLMLMWKFFGAWAPGWHLFNLILHLVAVSFVYLLLERFTKDPRLSGIASLVFAIHPMRSESVAWVSGVTDPLMAIFLIASIYLYVRYRDEGRGKLLASSLVLFLFAAFAKEPATVLPLFMGAYELFLINQDKRLGERIKPAIGYSTCFLFAAAIYFLARYYSLGFALNNSDFKSYPASGVLLTIPIVIWKYILLMVWPVDLSLFHATEIITNPLNIEFIVPFLALTALAFGLWRLRNSVVARFGILWFTINLLPVLNLSAFGEDFLVQERYAYVPSIGFSLLVGLAIMKVPTEKWVPVGSRAAARTALTVLLVVLLAGRTFAQNTSWKDDLTLWFHGAETAPEQPMPHYILGHKLIQLGDYQNAAKQLEEFLKLSPDNVIGINNLASANVIMYQQATAADPASADRALLDRALQLCEKGLARQGDFAPLWDTLGQIYTFETGLKNLDRAIACFQRGLSFQPNNAVILFHLGGTLTKKGDLENGIRMLQAALAIEPGIIDAHKFLAYAYRGRGQLQEAVDSLSTYLKLQPNAPDARRVAQDLQDLRAQLQASSPQS